MSAPLLLFDATADGHHPEYVRHVVRGLAARGRAAETVVAVPQAMLDAHPDLAAVGAQVLPLHPGQPTGSPWTVSQHLWSHLAEAVRRVRPARALLLYADALVPSLAQHARLDGDPRLWTIHFRPPIAQPGRRLRERLRDVVKRRQMQRMLGREDIGTAFSLDPRARASFRTDRVAALPDPVTPAHLTPAERAAARAHVRSGLGVGPERHLMMLFGVLEPRKGIFQTLEALARLPSHVAERLAVAFIGPVDPTCADAFADAAAAVDAASPAQVVVHDASVADRCIVPVLVAADTVLIPYQRHIGSSGVLIRAAGLAQPTIAQDAGLIGEWTHQHRLGRPVDSTHPDALARAITAAVLDPVGLFDPAAARAFAAGHTPEAFVHALLDGPAGLLS